jgi:hypothetical protein
MSATPETPPKDDKNAGKVGECQNNGEGGTSRFQDYRGKWLILLSIDIAR